MGLIDGVEQPSSTFFEQKIVANAEIAAWALQHVDVTPRTEGKIKITIRVEDGPYLAEAHVLVVSEAATAPLEVHSCDIPVDAREAKPLACVRVTDGYQGGTYDGG